MSKRKRNKVFEKYFLKVSNLIFVFGIIFLILLFALSCYKIYHSNEATPSTHYFAVLYLSLLGILFFIIGLKFFSPNIKMNLSLFFFTSIISIYSFEIYLFFLSSQFNISTGPAMDKRRKLAKENGISFDERNGAQVITDLKSSGIIAYPSWYPKNFISEHTNYEEMIYPLGGISNAKIVNCNETGKWEIYESDEYGFNNVKGLYSLPIDIMLIGDSYVEGQCVGQNKTIAGVLRDRGYNAISLGKGGNGPLIELATLIEYGKAFKPKTVFWMYYQNDIDDIIAEYNSQSLLHYLNHDSFTQDLTRRQVEIDSFLVDYINTYQKNKDTTKTLKNIRYGVFEKIFKIYNIRARINLRSTSSVSPELENILLKARKIVSDWGGDLYFICLPSFANIINDIDPNSALYLAKKLNIPTIDIHKELFLSSKDPLSFFPYKLDGHYNELGYRKIAEKINGVLKK